MKLCHAMLKATSAVLFIIGAAGAYGQNTPGHRSTELADATFWRQMAGSWEGDNTYFDSDMNYNVRHYNSLVQIEVVGRRFYETEHRFYPAGLGPSRYGNGLEQPGEGVELVVKTTGELIDAAGTLGNIRTDHTVASSGPDVVYRILSDNDAVRIKTNPATGVDNYRMYFSFITPDRRLRSNVGLHSADDEKIGSLRAFILYRDRRIDPTEFEARRAALRKRHNVKVLNVADPDNPGRSRVTRLD